MLTIIVATDMECGIGLDGTIPWKCPQDMRFFKETTTGGIIIMGRKTLESFPNGKPLPNRTNVVLTSKTPDNPVEGVVYVNSKEEALEWLGGRDAFIIGGGSIYELFADEVERILETDIDGVFGCDTYFQCTTIGYDSVELATPSYFNEKGCIASSVLEFKFQKGSLRNA